MFIFTDADPTAKAFTEFLKNYGIWIAVAVAGVAFLTILVLFFIALAKRKKEPTTLDKPKVIERSEKSEKIIEALGGKENILEHSLVGSRITLVLQNYDVINEDTLKKEVTSYIKMSNKIILVFKDDVSSIYQGMF